MTTRYFRRYRMEISLSARPFRRRQIIVPALPEDYEWVAWSPSLVTRHASVKYQSFRDEIDAEVFSTFREFHTCSRLMSEISAHPMFLPGTTWLIRHIDSDGLAEPCATIQGLGRNPNWGAIQNVGVIPSHRGFGLGRALVLKALEGFRQAGRTRVSLEVTAENALAVGLYQRLGFRITRTLYKAVPVAEAVL